MRDDHFTGEIAAAAAENIQAKNYWMNQLSGQWEKSSFPFDYIKKNLEEQKKIQSFRFQLQGELFHGLMKLCNRIDYSLHIILVGLITVLLEKYTGNNDIILGTPIYKQKISGKFINTILPLRNSTHEQMTFKELIIQVKETLMEAIQNQNYPISALLNDLAMEPGRDEFPLFDIVLLLENIHDRGYIRHIPTNVLFSFNRTEDSVTGVIEYNSLLYEKTTIERIASHFLCALREVLANLEARITTINILTPGEKNQLLLDFNNTSMAYPEDKTIPQLFAEQVKKIPDNIAIVSADKQWTYKLLNQTTNQLARVLIAKGVKPDSIVGIILEKSVDMVIAILGILKAGGAYLPIDPSYPGARQRFMINDCDMSLLVTKMRMMGAPPGGTFETFCLEGNRDTIFQQSTGNIPAKAAPNHLAYIIYTSGSTGLPKGVLIDHTSVANLKTWQSYAFGIGKGSRVMQFFSYSFDGAVGETFMAVLNGAALIMLGLEGLLPGNLVDAINRHKINLAVFVPAMIRQMEPNQLTYKDFTIVSVGEACSVDLVRKWSPKCTFVNGYGPTETTVYSHIWKAGPGDITESNSVPIGFPISNYKSYILDPFGNPTAIGVTGEMHISGVGVARGYLNQPEITAERFILNQFHPGDETFVEKGNLIIQSALQDISGFKREHASGSCERYDLKVMSSGEISHEEIISLVNGLDPDLVNKTRLYIDKYCSAPIFLGCFFRYLYEGSGNSYFSCGINEDVLKHLLAVETFQGLKGVDFGIGNAEIIQILANAGAIMKGFDFNPFFIQRARDKSTDIQMLRIDSPPGTFKEESGIEEGTQDFVISTLVLDRIENPRNLLKNLLWVIKPGGRFAIQTLLPILPVDDAEVEKPLTYTPETNRITPGKNVEEDKQFLASQLYELGAREICVYHFQYVVCSNDGIQDYLVWSFSGIKTVDKNQGDSQRYFLKSFKTGDSGCYLPDGNIKFLGRMDQQVKIRGFRVELEEIENQLAKYKEIKETVVIPIKAAARNDDDSPGNEDKETYDNLCAYIVSKTDLSIPVLKEFLSETLPHYMIPAYFVSLESLPLSPNGKVDRKRLPLPGVSTVSAEYIAPRDMLEEHLTEIWAAVLAMGKDVIGIDSNFFELGGHSLKAVILTNRIHKELNVKIPMTELFKSPTIRSIGDYIKAAQVDKFASIKPAEKKDYYPLSSQQNRLYIIQQMLMNSTAYNVNTIVRLEGETGIERLEKAFKKIIARHESLRTSFGIHEEISYQKIHNKDSLEFEIEYYHHASSTGEVEKIVRDFVRAFDLTKAPLIRVGLVKMDNLTHLLMVDMHHIITDVISHGILLEDFIALYNGKELPTLRLQYKEYSAWQQTGSTKEIFKTQEEYWKKEFAGEIPVLNLPTDFPRPAFQSFEGNKISFVTGEEETRALNQIAQSQGATMFMILLAVFNIFLSKLSSQDDIVVGIPIIVRRHADLEGIIGMFTNAIALRNYLPGEQTFEAFLGKIKERTIQAFENQDYKFETLVEKVAVERDTSRNPLFDVLFAFEKSSTSSKAPKEQEMKDLKVKPYSYESGTSQFDLTLGTTEQEDKLYFSVKYCTRLFKDKTIVKFINYFKRIIMSVIEDHREKISEIEIVSEEEKNQLLYGFNETEAFYPGDEKIHEMFETQVEKTPDNIAIIGISVRERRWSTQANANASLQQVSYKELNVKSNQLSRRLREKGVKSDTVVGLMAERSIEMIVTVLAILKSGGAYLPIDTDYPEIRKQYMIEESRVKLLLTTDDIENITTNIPNDIEIIDLKDKGLYEKGTGNPLHINRGTDIVYVLYTSGSTGNPKGVVLEHRNLVNLMNFQNKYTNIDCSRILQFATISFDASFHEIFSALLTGGRLYLIDGQTRSNVVELFNYIEKNEIKTLFLPMAFLRMVFSDDQFIAVFPRCVDHIQTAGEQVIVSDRFRSYLKKNHLYLHNHYGPTEAHVVTTLKIEPTGNIPGLPPIGKPVLNTNIYILDKWMHLVPIGVPGELYIGGIQVGRGYLNRPELTADRFVRTFINHSSLFPLHSHNHAPRHYHHHSSGSPYSTIYRTGDLSRWLTDGNIEYLGRKDYQVKIRGFRIEPGEIENQLIKHPNIKEAVVVLRENDGKDKYLCAYIVDESNKMPLKPGEFREYLSASLPDYMIPSYFTRLDKMPLTPSGKIDRKALPKPEIESGKEIMAPETKTQEKLLETWWEVLGVKKEAIGIDSNFFELGGHSLKATLLISRIHKILDIKIPMVELFKTPTIRGLSQSLAKVEREKYTVVEPVEKKEYYRLSSAQKRLFILQKMDPDSTAYNLPMIVEVEGEIEKVKFEKTFLKLINRHESLRTVFQMVDEKPLQKIYEHVEFAIDYYDISKVEADKGEQMTDQRGQTPQDRPDTHHSSFIIHHSFIRPFDLSQAPLLRVGLIKKGQKSFILMIDIHHIITDGISQNLLKKEFILLNAGEVLPPLRLQYKDYSQWQQTRERQDALTQQQEYWLKEFAGEIPVINLPTDFPRPAPRSFEGDAVHFEINKEETKALNELGRSQGATLFMVLLAIYNILLYKISSQEDIVVGTPAAGRKHADLEKIIGMFINMLALRNHLSGEKTFKIFLNQIKEKTIKSFENQDYQLEEIVEKIVVQRDMRRNPLFDVMFAFQNFFDAPGPGGIPAEDVKRLKMKPYSHEHRTSQFDFTLIAIEKEKKLNFSCEYCTKLFKKQTILRFTQYFKEIISSIIENPSQKISDIEMMNREEKERVLFEFNNTRFSYPNNKTIHRLFEEQVEKTPDHTALVGKNEGRKGLNAFGPMHLTYKELNNKSHQLAYILKERGVKPDTIVSIFVERSIRMIVGIMAILKAGGAYLPIEPGCPSERIDYMLKDCGSKILLRASAGLTGIKTQSVHIIDIDSPLSSSTLTSNLSKVSPANLAYTIYTSGTTGAPKGVMIEHRNVVNVVTWFGKTFALQTGTHLLLLTDYTFDPSVEDIFGSLSHGGVLYLVDKLSLLDREYFRRYVKDNDIRVINYIPTVLNELLGTGERLESLRAVISGGMPLDKEIKDRLLKKGYPLYNNYGPTEVTVDALFTRCSTGKVTLGNPIFNVRCYILNRDNTLCPPGVVGELCVAGDGIARGYMNQPEPTAEKFVRTVFGSSKRRPKSANDRLYLTGDLARWLPDGNIEFLGRIDNQVKISGYRIELEEIENQLLKHEQIIDAVVLQQIRKTGAGKPGKAIEHEQEDVHLCAYVVPVQQGTGEPEIADIKAYLANTLPPYMIPSFFAKVDKIPVTLNGKVDRNALASYEIPLLTGAEYIAPGNETEEILVSIWEEILGLEKVGIDDNFFNIGGNSILAIKVIEKVKEVFKNKDIPVAAMFRFLTTRSFASYLEQSQEEANNPGDDRVEKINEGKDRIKHTLKIMRRN
jgi:amino acid adenylation domain-containing protein